MESRECVQTHHALGYRRQSSREISRQSTDTEPDGNTTTARQATEQQLGVGTGKIGTKTRAEPHRPASISYVTFLLSRFPFLVSPFSSFSILLFRFSKAHHSALPGRAQKERIQALEAAVAKSLSAGGGGPSWTQYDDAPGTTDLLFGASPTVTAPDSGAFSASLSQPFLDPSLESSLTHHALGGGPGDVFGEFTRQSSCTTPPTSLPAGAATTASSTLSYDHYDQQSYDTDSAPPLTFASTTDDISILGTPASDGGMAAAADAAAEEAVAWSQSMDMMDLGGENGDATTTHSHPGTPPPAHGTMQQKQHYHHTSRYASPQPQPQRPPPEPTKRHYSRGTALHIAAAQCDSGMVQLLLDGGADARLLNKDGRTPLHLAVLAAGEAAKRPGGSASRSRCRSSPRGDHEGGGDCSSGSTAGGEVNEAEKTLALLLQARGAGADPRALDARGRSVVFTAVETGSEATVQMVLDAIRCDSSVAGSSSSPGSSSSAGGGGGGGGGGGAGSEATRAGIRAALNEPDAQGTLPLHVAVASGSASMVRLLLSHGADVNG